MTPDTRNPEICTTRCPHDLRCTARPNPAHGDPLNPHTAIDPDDLLHVWADRPGDCYTITALAPTRPAMEPPPDVSWVTFDKRPPW